MDVVIKDQVRHHLRGEEQQRLSSWPSLKDSILTVTSNVFISCRNGQLIRASWPGDVALGFLLHMEHYTHSSEQQSEQMCQSRTAELEARGSEVQGFLQVSLRTGWASKDTISNATSKNHIIHNWQVLSHTLSQHAGGRGRGVAKFEVSMVNRDCSTSSKDELKNRVWIKIYHQYKSSINLHHRKT